MISYKQMVYRKLKLFLQKMATLVNGMIIDSVYRTLLIGSLRHVALYIGVY